MIRRSAAIAAFLGCLSALPLSAGLTKDQVFRTPSPEELAMKSLPSAPGAPAAVLDWVRHDDHPTSATSEYVRIKVFTDEGKKYGDVEVPYIATYPFNGYVTDIEARTIHPDGKVIPFDGRVFDKTLLKKGGNTVRAKAFSFADVQPGSILEYHYVTRWRENLLLDEHWLIQKAIPVEHAKFSLAPYKSSEFATFFTFAALPPGKQPAKLGTENKYTLELEHIPAFRDEAWSLPEDMLKPRVNFYYTTSHLRPDQFWDAQPRDWQKESDAFINRSRDAQALAQSLVHGETDATAKLRRIYDHVQGFANRSIGADPELRDIRPAKTADDVLSAKGGTSIELARTFVALARAAGFDSDVVRVAPRDEAFFSDKLPDADQMNAEVAVVTLDGKPFYFDPGTFGAPFGVMSWEKTYAPAFRMTKGSAPQRINTPADPPSAAMLQRKADLHIDGETLGGTLTIAFRGQEALVRRQRGDDENGRRKELEHEIQGWFPNGATLKVTSIDGLTGDADAIVVKADAQLPGILAPAGTRVMMPLSIFAANAKNPFAPATRENPIYFPYSRQEDDEVRLTLPEKMVAVTVPAPASVNVGSFIYTTKTTQEGNVLTFHRGLVIDAMLFEAAQYNAVRNVFSTISTTDQRPLVLRAAGTD